MLQLPYTFAYCAPRKIVHRLSGPHYRMLMRDTSLRMCVTAQHPKTLSRGARVYS